MSKLDEYRMNNDQLNEKYDYVVVLYYQPTNELGKDIPKKDLYSKALGYLNTAKIEDLNSIQSFKDLLDCLSPFHDDYIERGSREKGSYKIYKDPKEHNCRMTKEEAEQYAKVLQRCLNGIELYRNDNEVVTSDNLLLKIKALPKRQLGPNDYIHNHEQEEKDWQKWKRDRYDKEVDNWRKEQDREDEMGLDYPGKTRKDNPPDYFNYILL